MPRTPVQALAFLFGLWFALWLSPFGANAEPRASAPYGDLEAGLHYGVNRVRGERHLIPLERHPELDAVARAHSLDMVKRHFFDHANPEGEVAPDRLLRARVNGFSLAAENIGITDRPEPNREILHAWIQSEVHRKNLFAPPFNATGIGIARAPNGSLVYTQIYVTYPR
jgi:uncharacterized protein YkwD